MEKLGLLQEKLGLLQEHLGFDPLLEGLNFWAALLLYLARGSQQPGLTLVLDEFFLPVRR